MSSATDERTEAENELREALADITRAQLRRRQAVVNLRYIEARLNKTADERQKALTVKQYQQSSRSI